MHDLLRREKALAVAERRSVGAGAIERHVDLHRRRPVRVGDRHRHEFAPARHARVEHERRLGRHRHRVEAAGGGERLSVVVQQKVVDARREVLPVRQDGIDARGREHGCGLVGRRAGIDRNAGAAHPLDGKERLDGGRCVPVPQSDAPSAEAAGE
jgi:hypothetical protein